MVESTRRTPLDLARERLFQKSYSALIRNDGTVLPIEERLGKRLLRTLAADSREGQGLLKRGFVTLKSPEGESFSGVPMEAILERLSRETSEKLARHAEDPEWQRRYRERLQTIGRFKRSLASDH